MRLSCFAFQVVCTMFVMTFRCFRPCLYGWLKVSVHAAALTDRRGLILHPHILSSPQNSPLAPPVVGLDVPHMVPWLTALWSLSSHSHLPCSGSGSPRPMNCWPSTPQSFSRTLSGCWWRALTSWRPSSSYLGYALCSSDGCHCWTDWTRSWLCATLWRRPRPRSWCWLSPSWWRVVPLCTGRGVSWQREGWNPLWPRSQGRTALYDCTDSQYCWGRS